jgi:hypothetical protein
MRADEFITEATKGKMHHHHDSVIPNAKTLPSIDQGYSLYRFGLHMASGPENANIPTRGPVGPAPFFVPYSAADEQIIDAARRAGGFGSVKNLTHGRSAEPDDTHKTSPVNNKANKRRTKR